MRFYLKKLLQNFLQGVLILAPLSITAYVVYSVFKLVDGILPGIITTMFPSGKFQEFIKNIPGLGFLVVTIVIIVIGKISSTFFVKKFVDIIDSLLEKTPGIKFIYSSIKDFIGAFAGNKKKFDKPVLVNIEGPDIWRVGFITQQDALHFHIHDAVVVYVPHSYAISGITYIVATSKIKIIDHITPADAMKFVVSGGVTEIHEQTP